MISCFTDIRDRNEVRDVMEKCHIHLFTSNYLEGWGAVVNEGMNSGCVEVVDARVGAAPYLIRHGENGLLYPGGRYEKMEALVLDLFENWEERRGMGRVAYETIRDVWNAERRGSRSFAVCGRDAAGKALPGGGRAA